MTRLKRDLCRDSSHGGPEGIRTPDLFIANEARYQLRHRPVNPVTLSRTPRRAESLEPLSAGGAAAQQIADVGFDLGVVDVTHAPEIGSR